MIRKRAHACTACGRGWFPKPIVCYWCRPENQQAIQRAQRRAATAQSEAEALRNSRRLRGARKAVKKKAAVITNVFFD
jgi:hypothetical protein